MFSCVTPCFIAPPFPKLGSPPPLEMLSICLIRQRALGMKSVFCRRHAPCGMPHYPLPTSPDPTTRKRERERERGKHTCCPCSITNMWFSIHDSRGIGSVPFSILPKNTDLWKTLVSRLRGFQLNCTIRINPKGSI